MSLSTLTEQLRGLVETGDRSYLAIVLDTSSRTRLLKWWRDETGLPLLTVTHAHHLTLKFEPSDDEISAAPMGKSIKFSVTGWAADEKAQAVKADYPVAPGVTRDSSFAPVAHVTVSVAAGVMPSYSKELLSKKPHMARRVVLSGVVTHVKRDE